MVAKMKEDLAKYRAELEGLNSRLEKLEAEKQQIIKVGTRLEGVVAYLRQAIDAAEKEVGEKCDRPASL